MLPRQATLAARTARRKRQGRGISDPAGQVTAREVRRAAFWPRSLAFPRRRRSSASKPPQSPGIDHRRAMEIFVNGAARQLPDDLADPALPLLWALRDLLGLTGTKFGCGVAACGACTVHVDGAATRSCTLPIGKLEGRRVVTIEALGSRDAPHPLQRAWAEHQVPQCGYCQSGVLMAAAALLARTRRPSDAEIDAAIDNVCRCGTYPRLRAAIRAAATAMA